MSIKISGGGGGGGGIAIGGDIGSGTSGSVLFVDATGKLAQDNANFSYNSTTHNLVVTGGLITGGAGTGKIVPGSDSTTAVQITKADGTTVVINIDTTNSNVGINVTSPTAFLHLSAPTTGKASIRLTASSAVDPSAPNSGDLWWNGTNLYFYNGSTNKDLLGGGGMAIGGAVGSGTSGCVLYVDSTVKLAQDSTNFFWDASNKRLGICTNNPQQSLHIASGNSYITNGSYYAYYGTSTFGPNNATGYSTEFLMGNTWNQAGNHTFLFGSGSTDGYLKIFSTTGVGSGDYVSIAGGNNGGTEIARFNGSGNISLGTASTNTVTFTARMVVRTLGSNPKDATPGNRPAGTVAEMGYYSGKLYLCTNSATPTWELITSV